MTNELLKYYPLLTDRYTQSLAEGQTEYFYKASFGEDKFPSIFDLAKNPVLVESVLSTCLMDTLNIPLSDKDAVRSFMAVSREVTGTSGVWNRPGVCDRVTLGIFNNASFGFFWHHYRWRNSGRRIYDLSYELAELFAGMEMNFPVDNLQLPYPEFFIAVDTNETVYNAETGEHQIAGMYVSDIQTVQVLTDEPRRVRLDLTCPDGVTRAGTVRVNETYPGRHIELSIVGWPHDRTDVGNDAIFRMSLPLTPGQPIEESLARDYEWRSNTSVDPASAKNANRLVKRWSRIAMNMLVYLTSIEPDIEERWAMPQHLRDRAAAIQNVKQRQRFIHKNCKNTRVIYIGHERFKSTHASPVGHIRKGHSRWQACGPKWSTHKLVYIRPVWVRGQDGEQVPHITDVTNTEEKVG